MSVSVRYCDNCGVRIPPEDVEAGRAYCDETTAYCVNCAPTLRPVLEATPVEQPVAPKKHITTQARKRYGTSWVKVKKERRVDEYERREEETPLPSSKRKSSGLIIGVIVGIVVFAIIIIAIAASSGSKRVKPEEPSEEISIPKPVPVKPNIVEPPEEEPPVPAGKSVAERKLEDALNYARNHPTDFDKVIDMLEAIQREETVTPELSARIERAIAEYMGRWDIAAKEAWGKLAEEATVAEKSGDISKAISVYESLPQVCAKHTEYSEKMKKEVVRLKTLQEAKEAFAQIEPLLSQIDSSTGLEELRRIKEQIAEFGSKYESTEYIEKLKEPYAKLNEIIAELEKKAFEEEMKRREEEERRRQEEIARQEEQRRAQEWQQQKSEIEAFLRQSNMEQNALPELQVGRQYRLFNGADTNGWARLAGSQQEFTLTVQNGEIVGSNSSANQSGVFSTHYKRQSYWENYTLECKILVSRGVGGVGVRVNVDQNRRVSGTIHQFNQNQWVSVKAVVKGDRVEITVDNIPAGTYQRLNWQAGFVGIWVGPGSEVRVKDLLFTLESVKR